MAKVLLFQNCKTFSGKEHVEISGFVPKHTKAPVLYDP